MSKFNDVQGNLSGYLALRKISYYTKKRVMGKIRTTGNLRQKSLGHFHETGNF